MIGVQGLGYTLHLNFFGVSDVDICINRVYNRVLQGGHFVRPDIVKMRYEAGLKLLKYYKDIPNRLILTDNTTESTNCTELSLGTILYKSEVLPEWVTFILSEVSTMPGEFYNIDAVREKYRQMKGNKESESEEIIEP